MSNESTDGPTDDSRDAGDGDADEPADEEVVRTAAEAAEGVVFAHYDQSAVTDLDVTVTFEEGVLDVDVYLNAPDDPDPDAVAREAAETAGEAVDELFEA
ncbi:DUF3194 domain-containing protein [Halorubrum lipolyticum]|uniref:DUF3194 domain-containing protein n=1 Tax=Halorubrum lipolyticum DSM 21995 TaxID=1227482 RepID=M0NVJ5_9EURY|nr:DUF3194 domain-containing protein [Halorubrum lipolyticum]EMA61977.1 hypothetical protein C469_05972 [Halorubrum lipolyticum DSM 21995]